MYGTIPLHLKHYIQYYSSSVCSKFVLHEKNELPFKIGSFLKNEHKRYCVTNQNPRTISAVPEDLQVSLLATIPGPRFFTARCCVSPYTVVCTGIKNPMKQTISSPASRNGRRGKWGKKNTADSASMFYQVGIFQRIISNLFWAILAAMTHGIAV